jgi:hypothetical protein
MAAAVPIAYWGSFFPALLVRGTGLDDPPHPVGRIAGIPANLFWATVTTASAFGGWLLDRRALRPGSPGRGPAGAGAWRAARPTQAGRGAAARAWRLAGFPPGLIRHPVLILGGRWFARAEAA